MKDWLGKNVCRFGFVAFALILSVLSAVPEDALAIGCGGGLFGGRSRRQERRASRVEGRQARFGAAGCAGAAFGCSGNAQFQQVHYQHYQAPTKQALSVCPTCPANKMIEKDYPQASVVVEEHFVSIETPFDAAWDKVPEINIPQW